MRKYCLSFPRRQNMSDHSLLILAFDGAEIGAKTAHKSQEISLSGAIARDRRRAGRSDRSHSRQGRLRQGQHQPHRRSGGRERRLALPIFPQQGGARCRRHRAPPAGDHADRRGELAEVCDPAVGARRCASSSPSRSRRIASIPSCIACSRSRFRAWESSRSWKPSTGKTTALFRAYLESHRDELRVDDLELASFVCVTSIEALTHNAVLHHSKMLPDEAMEALIDEAARLVIGYLKG